MSFTRICVAHQSTFLMLFTLSSPMSVMCGFVSSVEKSLTAIHKGFRHSKTHCFFHIFQILETNAGAISLLITSSSHFILRGANQVMETEHTLLCQQTGARQCLLSLLPQVDSTFQKRARKGVSYVLEGDDLFYSRGTCAAARYAAGCTTEVRSRFTFFGWRKIG